MQYAIEDKIFINDKGDQVKYKRLVVTGYLNGQIETIELPISRDQATIYNAMKSEAPTVEVKKGGEVETKRTSNNSLLDDDEKGLFD